MKNRITAALLALSLLILPGCGGGEETADTPLAAEDDGKVVICVDQPFYYPAKAILAGMKLVGDAPDIELDVIPQDNTLRAAKITAIKTALMAGEGPDAFLFFNDTRRYKTNAGEPLFAEPAKLMELDVFLPLDELMENGTYIKPDRLNQAVLAAGRNEKGQMILPLTYTVPFAAVDRARMNDPEFAFHSWQELVSADEPLVRNAMTRTSRPWFSCVFSQLADFSNESLLISREELAQRLKEGGRLGVDGPWAGNVINSGFLSYLSLTSEDYSTKDPYICPLYNDAGGITAIVTMAAAINANTSHAKEAFSFIDMMFHRNILNGRGIGGSLIGAKFFEEYDWNDGIFIQEIPVQQAFPQIVRSTLPALKTIQREITTARFSSELDNALSYAVFQARWVSDGSDSDIERIADECYDKMLMILAE